MLTQELLRSGELEGAQNYLLYKGEWSEDKFHGNGATYLNGNIQCVGKFEGGNTSGFIHCNDHQYNGGLNETGLKHGEGIIIEDLIDNP